MTPNRSRYRVPIETGEIETIAEGDGPLFVMFPSSSRDSEDFDLVAARFTTAGLRVLRPQPRGMGRSRAKLDGPTLHDYAADVAAVICHAARGPAVVLGHAFGPWVARTQAADQPTLVRGLVLAAAAAKSPPSNLRAALARCAETSLPYPERLAALQTAFFAPGHDASSGSMAGTPALAAASALPARQRRQRNGGPAAPPQSSIFRRNRIPGVRAPRRMSCGTNSALGESASSWCRLPAMRCFRSNRRSWWRPCCIG